MIIVRRLIEFSSGASQLAWPAVCGSSSASGSTGSEIVRVRSDCVAVMFPLTPHASAVTMGSPTDPVNAWYWKGNLKAHAFDVVATGYGTSGRHLDTSHPIRCSAHHASGQWQVVLSRSLAGADGRVSLKPGGDIGMAFAVWDGGNRERSGRKSFSGDFVRVSLDP